MTRGSHLTPGYSGCSNHGFPGNPSPPANDRGTPPRAFHRPRRSWGGHRSPAAVCPATAWIRAAGMTPRTVGVTHMLHQRWTLLTALAGASFAEPPFPAEDAAGSVPAENVRPPVMGRPAAWNKFFGQGGYARLGIFHLFRRAPNELKRKSDFVALSAAEPAPYSLWKTHLF